MTESQLALLRRYGIRPVKRRGQNFLLDGNLARSIADAAAGLGSRVLELGAGGGALTGPLLERCERVVSVEVDRHLCGLLRAEFGHRPEFCLLEADLTRLDWQAALAEAGPGAVVAGNLPYVLTSTVLFALAERREELGGAVLMVQREVAERLVAAPGGRDYGVLTVALGAIFDIEVLRTVPPTVFWPRPEVESAVVRLTGGQRWDSDEYQEFLNLVKTIFGQRRKQLGTILRDRLALDPAAVDRAASRAKVAVQARPEQLAVAELRSLAQAVHRELES